MKRVGVLLAATLFGLSSCGDPKHDSVAAPLPGTHADHGAAPTPSIEGVVYTCSMHPQVRLPKPGKCPICQMSLVLAKGTMGKGSAAGDAPSMLELSDHARAMAAVETATVRKMQLFHEVRAVGRVQYNETGLATITSRVDGYVEKLHVDFTGIAVNPGDHLVDIYSPDLIAAQQELIFAESGSRNPAAIEGTRLKLLRWGLTETQVDEVAHSRKASQELTLFSPIKGTVIEKNVVLKSMAKAGDVLYRLANLDSVWLYLDIYEYELPWVQYGQTASVSTEALPGETFSGRVWFINPVLTEESRTVKVLVAIDNRDRRLKPGMYVSATIKSQMLADGKAAPSGVAGQFTCTMHPMVLQRAGGPCPVCQMPLRQIPGNAKSPSEQEQLVIAVPVTAVLDSGLRKLVYREKAKGEFEPVEVVVGPRSDAYYPVLKGLAEGDLVAARGGFMLDSQFQIQGLPSLFYPQGQAGASGHQHGGAGTPSPAAGATPMPAGHKH